MSDTPRTDAEERDMQWDGLLCKAVRSEIARRLERQNAELLEAVGPALRYIEHIGANRTECGEPHPQQWIVDRLRAAIAKAEAK